MGTSPSYGMLCHLGKNSMPKSSGGRGSFPLEGAGSNSLTLQFLSTFSLKGVKVFGKSENLASKGTSDMWYSEYPQTSWNLQFCGSARFRFLFTSISSSVTCVS